MFAATHVGYLVAAWGIALGVLGAYSVRIIQKGRSLAKRVPPEERRWS